MEIKTADAVQRKEFFKNSFKGNFSYKSGTSSVNSFLQSMTQNNPGSQEDKAVAEKKLYSKGPGASKKSRH